MNYALLHMLSGGFCIAVTLNAVSRRGGVRGMRLALAVLTGGASLSTVCLVSGGFVATPQEALPYFAGIRLGVGLLSAGAMGVGYALWGGADARRVERFTLLFAGLFGALTLAVSSQVPVHLVIRSALSWHVLWAPVLWLDSALSVWGTLWIMAGALRRLASGSPHGRSTAGTVLTIQVVCLLIFLLLRWRATPATLQASIPLVVGFLALAYWLVLHRWRLAGVADSALVVLFEQSPTPSVVIDLHTDRAQLNPAAAALLPPRISPDEVARRLGLGQDSAQGLLTALHGRTETSVRIRGVEPRVFDLHCHFDARQGVGLLLLNEVTDRVAHAEELSSTLSALRQAQDQLVMQEKIAALGVLVAGVNHEINNPLAYVTANLQALRGYLHTALRAVPLARGATGGNPLALERLTQWVGSPEVAELTEDAEAALGEAVEGCSRIRETVASMRMLSRKEDTEQALDLSEVARAGLKIGRTTLAPSVEVVAQLEAPLPIRGGAGELSRVITNLVVNAGQALGDQGRLTVRSFRRGQWAVLQVADNGPGVPPELRSRIFEPFFTTKQPGVGTGLGLAISFETLRRHGGELVLCEAARGACFELRLPVGDASMEEPEPPPLALRRRAATG